MKKTLTAAITTALVIGAASTTFAAANPFTDVPTGHWSYDAVAKLAQDGVIEGYGDGTFRGDKAITRYEMAQMVAKAMAKSDVSAADKAAIDKLAAEYSAELNNLGVRVGELENKVDNVKWGGKARLRSEKISQKNDTTGVETDSSYGHSYFELWATAKINADWTAKAEFEGEHNLNNNQTNFDKNKEKLSMETAIFNGWLGELVYLDEVEQEGIFKFNEGSGLYVFKFEDIKDKIALGYSISTHKSQGGEWKYLFFALDFSSYSLLMREILYTSASRAKKFLYCSVNEKAFNLALKQVDTKVRRSELLEHLGKEYKKL